MIKTFTDQMGRSVDVQWPPARIISLVPSQTEMLHHLGLENEVVGITKFCIHPNDWYKKKKRVGGTKNIDLDTILQLKPDVIIANKEENEMTQILELSKHFPVWISDINTLDQALDMIGSIGQLVNKTNEASQLTSDIKSKFQFIPSVPKHSAVYLIWNNPMMTINRHTFINDMLHRCGLQNVFANANNSRYPEITEEQLIQSHPELLLLSSEPFPFAEKHITHFSKILPNTKVMLVDGEMFSWYGSRLLQSPEYFRQLLQEIDQPKI